MIVFKTMVMIFKSIQEMWSIAFGNDFFKTSAEVSSIAFDNDFVLF